MKSLLLFTDGSAHLTFRVCRSEALNGLFPSVPNDLYYLTDPSRLDLFGGESPIMEPPPPRAARPYYS